MSHDPHHHPVESVAYSSDDGMTKFEGTDASVGIIVGSLLVIVLTLAISAAVVVPIHKLLRAANPPGELPSPIAPARVVPQKPTLQVHPWLEYPDVLAAWNQQLNSYGKNAAGQTHIPINQAINEIASQLPVRPNAPEGYTVPGGQGRDFSKGLADMPAPYQQQQPPQGPTIQGEIRKNAKQ